MTDVAVCPAGHESRSTDYCDECGLPIAVQSGLAPAARPSAPASAPSGQRCPSCGTAGPSDALFCEACGYDFTTGTMPRGTASELLGLQRPFDMPPVAGAAPQAGSAGAAPVAPSPLPAAVPTSPPTGRPAAPSPASSQPVVATGSSAVPQTGPPIGGSADAHVPNEARPRADEAEIPTAGSPLARPTQRWVAEVWIDPDWYRMQASPDPLPSPGLPEIFPLPAGGGLIGRMSRSQHLIPEIDCGSDAGCSRRQAMLTGDGRRWWVEDLGSANGTFVGLTGEPLPSDPPASGRVELTPDSRIYVGAWTRIVVRPATSAEDALFA